MMKELKGTKTEKNLQEAFAGESQARNKYSYWASKAKKDGYVQIAAIFRMAQEAREEGFDEIAEKFEGVAKIEKEHEARYRKLLDNIKKERVFSKDGDVIWQCSNCGHIVIGKKAPEECPVCNHPQAYFQVKAENY